MPKKNSSLKLSRPTLVLIFFCIAVSLLTVLFLVKSNSAAAELEESVNTSIFNTQKLHLLHTIQQDLLIAEADYRLYINSFDSSHKKAFMQHFSIVNDSINALLKLCKEIPANNLQSQLNQQHKIMLQLGNAKQLADAVLFKQEDTTTQTIIPFSEPYTVSKINNQTLENILREDTMNLFVKTGKKGFFKKLGSLFSNKEDSVAVTVKNRIQNNVQQKILHNISTGIQKFYQKDLQKQVTYRKKINYTEKVLAESKINLIQELKNILQSIIANETQNGTKQKVLLAQLSKNSHHNILYATVTSVIVLLIFGSLLFWNLLKVNKYEKSLIAAKENAEKDARIKSNLMAYVSHEVRSPLTAILGFSEQLLQQQQEEKSQQYIKAIKVSGENLLYTVNDILDYSKLAAQKSTLNLQTFNISQLANDVFITYHQIAERKGLLLKTQVQTNHTYFTGDVGKLRQITFNLISNAIKFTKKGTVESIFSITEINDKMCSLTLTIKDSGVGIPADELDLVFEEFHQSSNLSKLDSPTIGTGLGLTITKQLTELMHGKINVKSIVNKGTVFTVTVLLEKAEKDDDEKKILTQDTTNSPFIDTQKNNKLLLVEDNEFNITLFSMLLKKNGFAFDVAKDGEEAIEKINSNSNHLILTDINLPKMSGLDLTKYIRTHPNHQINSLPIIAFTANVLQEHLDAYMQAGINDCIAKPVMENQLIETIKKYL